MQSLLKAGLFLHIIRLTTVAGVMLVSYITSRRNVFQAIVATLFGLAAPAVAHASVAAGYISSGRLGAIVAGVVGLISVIIGRLALTRSASRISSRRLRAIVALVVGLTGMVLSVIHLARSTGGIGTGNGRAGAFVALLIGLIGMVLGGLALARSRRITTDSSTETARHK